MLVRWTRPGPALLWIVALAACDGLIVFDLTREIPEQRVQGNVVGAVLADTLQLRIPLDVDLEYERNARDTGPVQEVRVSALRLAITDTAIGGSGDEDDFDFLDDLQVYVRSSQEGSELPRVRVAYLEPVPRGRQQLELDTTGEDIKRHVEEGAVIVTEVRGSLPGDDVTFDGEVIVTVEAL